MPLTIGLAYDLRSAYLAEGFSVEETAEFDREDTIEAIESTLKALGYRTDRIGHGRDLVQALAAGRRWDLVFNIAEGLYGIGREAQVPAILDLYQIPYTFSDPLVMSLTLHKGMTKRVVRDAGIATADFYIAETPLADLSQIFFDPPFFAKPVAEGTGKGIGRENIVHDRQQLSAVCQKLIAAFHQPVIIESYLPGREFTTGIVGTGENARSIGSIEVHLLETAEAGVYSYANKAQYESRVRYTAAYAKDDPVVAEAEAIALAAWRALGCRDAGRIDLRCDRNGRPQFIEVNPLAGIHPQHSDLPIICRHHGIAYTDLIAWIMASATARINTPLEVR